jgi:hypothetical protein
MQGAIVVWGGARPQIMQIDVGNDMELSGHCYCGAIRYTAQPDIKARIQCCCRECQYISGGNPNVMLALPSDSFRYETGVVKQFTRLDVANPVVREFCPICGTHLLSRSPRLPGLVLVKVGTLDQPALFDKPDFVQFISECQAFHVVPDGVPAYEGRRPAQGGSLSGQTVE